MGEQNLFPVMIRLEPPDPFSETHPYSWRVWAEVRHPEGWRAQSLTCLPKDVLRAVAGIQSRVNGLLSGQMTYDEAFPPIKSDKPKETA